MQSNMKQTNKKLFYRVNFQKKVNKYIKFSVDQLFPNVHKSLVS